ncbi:unnamed protein product [Mytilus edulis]|uniref:Uncharacterized protein n=1 Tax=Mytilus edulis TaxID=6550 RepID=A0A8S3TKW9_MYTED|nr:unnamed protein product [Mytilus edulis]
MEGKKRKNSNNTKSGLTPPYKTGSKMATNQNNQNNMNISQVLTQAHESLHGSYTEVPINNNVNNNQTFTCSPNQTNQLQQSCTRPVLQSTPLPVQSSVNYQQSAPVPMQFLPPSVPSSVQTESLMPILNITPQMIYSNINDTNHRLQRLKHVMNDKLSKLDLLDMFAEKFEKFENHISKMSNEMNDIRNVQQKHLQTISKQENHHHQIEDRVRNLERSNRKLESENFELKEKFLELQSHSMKYNLTFGGIRNQDGYEENTEDVLRSFLLEEMEIPNVGDIQFQNLHRLGERSDGKERSIIARFTRFSDHERVNRAAASKLKNKPQFSIYQQYPREINERRKKLIPKMKEFKRQRRHAKLVYDKLLVDGEVYNLDARCEAPPTIPGQPLPNNDGDY